MPESTPMTITERYQYLGRMGPRYQRADRSARGPWLDEMALMTGLHRKSLVRLLAPGGLTRERRTRERGCVYAAAVDDVVRVVWETLDCVCAERLTPALVSTAQLLRPMASWSWHRRWKRNSGGSASARCSAAWGGSGRIRRDCPVGGRRGRRG